MSARKYASLSALADQIEAELKRIGLFEETPPPPEAFAFQQAFAGDTMSYAQWLQFVMLPRIREIVANRGPLPPGSSTAAQAVREFDGSPIETGHLVSLLYQLDTLVGLPPLAPGTMPAFEFMRRTGGLWRGPLFLAAALLWVALSFGGAIVVRQRLIRTLPPRLSYSLVLENPGGPWFLADLRCSGDLTGSSELRLREASLAISRAKTLAVRPPLEIDLVNLTFRDPRPSGGIGTGKLSAERLAEWLIRDDDRAGLQADAEKLESLLEKLAGVRSPAHVEALREPPGAAAAFRVSEVHAGEPRPALVSHDKMLLGGFVVCVAGLVPMFIVFYRATQRAARAAGLRR